MTWSGGWLQATLPEFGPEGPPGGGNLGWGGVGSGIPPPDPSSLPLPGRPGGLGIPGPGRRHRRPDHGEGGTSGKILHSPSFGLCLCGSGHHGHPDHREQAGPVRHDPHRALHDLRGPASGLHPGHCGFPGESALPGPVPGHSGGGSSGTLSPGVRGGPGYGPDSEIHGFEERPDALCHGVAAVSVAHPQVPGAPASRSVQDLPEACRNGDSGCGGGSLGSGPPAPG